MCTPPASAPPLTRTERWLDVDDRRPVDCLQVADLNSCSLNSEDAHRVQSDWVWPILRASREHALQGLAEISPRVHDKHVALCAMQPGQHDEIITDLQIAKSFAKPGVEDDPCVWRSFIALFGRAGWIGQRRFDPADRLQLIAFVAHNLLYSRLINSRLPAMGDGTSG
jgi:hypothetical protein